jgi:hypothetical protein
MLKANTVLRDLDISESGHGMLSKDKDGPGEQADQVQQLTRIYTITNCCLLSATSCTWILTTTGFAEEISKGLSGNAVLSVLNLSTNYLESEGGRSIAQAIKVL